MEMDEGSSSNNRGDVTTDTLLDANVSSNSTTNGNETNNASDTNGPTTNNSNNATNGSTSTEEADKGKEPEEEEGEEEDNYVGVAPPGGATEEKEKIKEVYWEEKDLKLGDDWYIITSRWIRAWKDYVGWKVEPEGPTYRPDKIDTTPLLISGTGF